MELYNRRHEEGECEHAPIRGSIVILVAKLLLTLIFFELIYAGIYYVLILVISKPPDLHHHVAIAIFVLEIVKILLQVFLILNITLSWANKTYHINSRDKHLIRRTGILNIKEDTYEFNTVRSISVEQSWLGRIFRFGDVTLKTSASGGYQAILTIAGIQNPKKYEQMIKECL